jgi:succinyl-diaminopimelate desuccinylase
VPPVLGDRLAARTLELIDIPSPSRDEAMLAEHIRSLLDAEDLGDTCLLARRGAPVLLAGHLDTVPLQDNVPGRRDDDRVHGCGASEELPGKYSALTPLLEREALDYELVVMMEPTDNELHAGCVGNINATWTFTGRSAHSARPWDGDNAIHKAARGIAALAEREPEVHVFDGLTFYEVASVTEIEGGIASNVVPDRAVCGVNYRFAPGRTPDEAGARLRELCPGGELVIDSLAPSGAVATANPRAQALIAAGNLRVAPKQAWTPVAEFGLNGLDAVNFGPGEPAQAHRRDESIEVAALVRSYEVLEAFAK